MDDLIIKRLKYFLAVTKTKVTHIARETGINKDKIYKWKAGSKPSSIDDYNKLEAYLDKHELLHGIIREPRNVYTRNEPKHLRKLCYYTEADKNPEIYSGEHTAGSIVEINGNLVLVTYEPDSATHGEAECLLNIKGDILEPRYNKSRFGLWTGLRRIKPNEPIYTASLYYFVDRDRNLFIGTYRTSPEGESVTIVPVDNRKAPIIIYKKDILFQFKIEWIQDNFHSEN
jgi:hypothetical protein